MKILGATTIVAMSMVKIYIKLICYKDDDTEENRNGSLLQNGYVDESNYDQLG